MNTDLFFNNLKLSFRQFLKAPGFSFIHTFGTTLGLSAVLIIYLYLKFEMSFDDFHAYSKDTYRINLIVDKGGKVISQSARTSPAFGSLTHNFSGIENFSRAVLLGEVIVSNESHHIREQSVLMTDPAHLQLFQYQILKGDPNTMLVEPLSVVLSRNVSRKLFGEADPIGRIIRINSENFDGTVEFEVKGIFENQKENAHLRPEILVSYSTLHHFIGSQIDQSWGWHNLYTYIRSANKPDVKFLESKLTEEVNRQYGETLKKKQEKWIVQLQPIESIHTTTSFTGEFEPGMSIANLAFLAVVAIFVIIVVLTNSINLTISRSLKRAKEVGVRKVSGAYRFQLILQFLTESFLIQIISTLTACLTISLLYPHLKTQVNMPFLSGWELLKVLWAPAALYFILGSLLSGLYPAIVLSERDPSMALRGTGKFTNAGLRVRKSLLAVQFSISIVMIVGTLTTWQQLQFMNNYNLGLDVLNKLIVRAARVQDEKSNVHAQTFRDKIKEIPAIKAIASLNEIPGNEIYWRSESYHRKGKVHSAVFSWLTVGDHYFDLLKIPITVGRSFKRQSDNYQSSIILNETAVKAFGFSDVNEAIGSRLELGDQEVEIVGVAADFHQEGLSKKIEPTVFRYSTDALNYFVIDISSSYSKNDLQQVEQVFKNIFPDSPYEFFFLEEHFNKQYQSETLFSKTGTGLSIFALVLAAIGLAGLSLQTISQRTKELVIRKVLGATPHSLAILLSKEYLKILVVAGIVSLPLSFAVFNEWLKRFAFRIDLSGWLFLVPLLIIFLISVLSIGWQTMRAANTNPVEGLRHE